MRNNSYTVASFFSGCGGLDYGFHKKGFKILFGNDSWSDAAKSFSLNYPKVEFITTPIQEISAKQLHRIIGKEKIDVLIGGPPCQCFTRLNNNHLIKLSEQKKEDNRRTLSTEYIKKVKLLRPKIVIMENVKDMLIRENDSGETYKEIIKQEFERIGYTSIFKIIKMEKYGIPQKRVRVIFIATNISKFADVLNRDPEFFFPKTVSKEKIVKDALKIISSKKDYENHEITENDQKTLERIKHIPPGGYYEDLPVRLKVKKKVNGKEIISKRYGSYFRRLDPDKPAVTITKNYLIHPTKDRYLSNREKAIIHTFPPSYKFYGSMGSVSQQIANAVPPRFSELLAHKILKVLSSE